MNKKCLVSDSLKTSLTSVLLCINNNKNIMTLLHCTIVDAGNNYSTLNLSGEGTFLVFADSGK